MFTYYSTLKFSLHAFDVEEKLLTSKRIISAIFALNKSTQYFLITESPKKYSVGFDFLHHQIYKNKGYPFLVNSFNDFRIEEISIIVESEEFLRGLAKIFICKDEISPCSTNAVSDLFYANFHEKFIGIYFENDSRELLIVNIPINKNEATSIFTPLLIQGRKKI